MTTKRSFWISLCLINLCIVAFLGFSLRSKILFSIPAVDYRNFLSAHSHFAFGGWAGLTLMTLLIFDLLPAEVSQKKIYQWILGGIEISSLGMALIFPFYGYNVFSISFSTLYIIVSFVFAPVFIKDIARSVTDRNVRLLSISAIASLIVSTIGPLGLAYILISKSGNSILYRDSIYTFLHFQYNGFFTLSVFALFLNYFSKKTIAPDKRSRPFAVSLCLSVLPALALSLLWHNHVWLYMVAGIGGVFILLSLVHFFRLLGEIPKTVLFKTQLARTLWLFSVFSFGLKMLLNAGTLFPQLGQAVYGDRPVIIGFLHLVFLGFLSFFILSTLVENRYFTKNNKTITYPFVLFSIGVIANEGLLMLQGLGVLFNTNSSVYNWMLWFSSIALFAGAFLIIATRLYVKASLVDNER
jgi:hypothetical protein